MGTLNINSAMTDVDEAGLPARGLELLEKLKAQTARVGIIGLGYVGLPLAVTAATRGNPVVGIEINPNKNSLLEQGSSYIDAVSDEALQAVSGTTFSSTSSFAALDACDVIVICVPTPLSSHRDPDLSYVESAGREIAKYMKPGVLIVLESTTYPGTTQDILVPILETSGLKAGEDFFMASSPEREDPGNKSFNTSTIPKIVGGDGEMAAILAQQFYSGVVDRVVPVSSTRAAEAVKITENIFRAVNIGLVNELKTIYDAMGLDIWEIIDGAATKPFGFMPFYPGPGLGGHCIPIDPFYLTWKAREHDLPTKFVELAGEVNQSMPRYVVQRTREVIDRTTGKGLSSAKILVIGVAYKKNVGDMRESPALRILEYFEAAGSTVDFYDPMVPFIPKNEEHPTLEGRTSVSESAIISGAYEAVIIATDHDKVDYAKLAESGIPIIDTRNVMQRNNLPMDNVTKA
nr:nucleotide sugar dehydrogenase [Hyphomonas sp. Mor2]